MAVWSVIVSVISGGCGGGRKMRSRLWVETGRVRARDGSGASKVKTRSRVRELGEIRIGGCSHIAADCLDCVYGGVLRCRLLRSNLGRETMPDEGRFQATWVGLARDWAPTNWPRGLDRGALQALCRRTAGGLSYVMYLCKVGVLEGISCDRESCRRGESASEWIDGAVGLLLGAQRLSWRWSR